MVVGLGQKQFYQQRAARLRLYKTRSTFYLKGKANRAVGEQFNIMAFALGVDIQSNLL